MSEVYNPTANKVLIIIGRPVLNGQWQHEHFPTRNITRHEQRLRNAHYQVHTYPVPPIFDASAARQLLTTSTNYSLLSLNVSFLELDHHQCATILNGLTTLMDNLPGQVDMFIFVLEYETGNAEHFDAVQQARDVIARRGGCHFFDWPNVHIEALSKMSAKGDDGHGPLDEDD